MQISASIKIKTCRKLFQKLSSKKIELPLKNIKICKNLHLQSSRHFTSHNNNKGEDWQQSAKTNPRTNCDFKLKIM